MPKEKISDDHMTGWYTEVSWRREEYVCHECKAVSWTNGNHVAECGHCGAPVKATSGHVQLASVNPASPFVFVANPHAPEDEPAEPFDGWRVTLDAAQIDYLIAVLRKARRQAYPKPGTDVTITMSPSSVPNGGPAGGYPIAPVWRQA